MDFRNRLLLGLMILALGVAGLQVSLGYWSFKAALDQDLSGDLANYLMLVEATISLEGSYPTLNPAKLSVSNELQGRIRLSKDGRIFLEGGGQYPDLDPVWVRTEKALEGGYRLEVALSGRDHNRSLREYLRTSLIAVLLSLGLAVLLAVALRRFLIRPLRSLETATLSLSEQRFPAPLPVLGRDELARLTRSFNRMVEKLRQAMEREKSFTRYASHELRTPLAAIKANLGAVRSGAIPQEELLQVVGDNLAHMERTLEGLLSLARGLSEPRQTDIALLLSELVQGLPEPAQQRICLQADPISLVLPQEALAAVVRNLLDNALKYGQGAVDLTFSLGNPHRLAVRDHGPGVPEEALTRLGEPFFRVCSDLEGTGLGLTYVRQVAEALGGRLELRNHPQGGFEATLWLPGDPHA